MLTLSNRASLGKRKKRIGRGGSRGGTSGSGHKGQKARSGAGRKIGPAFEGGQMPLHRRLPKRGFNNTRFQKDSQIINTAQLEKFFNNEDHVTKEALVEKGLVNNIKIIVKILANGDLTKKLTITVDKCSGAATEKIQSCGGKIQSI
jgi:large subunit ribosomal protein L15